MYVVICYDISSNSRRSKLHEMLLGYGTPVQKSVFECNLTQSQFKKLLIRVRPFAKKAGESVRYYQMCGKCQNRIKSYGIPLAESGDLRDIFV